MVGTTRPRGDLLHEQVQKARLHRLQWGPEGPQFAVERRSSGLGRLAWLNSGDLFNIEPPALLAVDPSYLFKDKYGSDVEGERAARAAELGADERPAHFAKFFGKLTNDGLGFKLNNPSFYFGCSMRSMELVIPVYSPREHLLARGLRQAEKYGACALITSRLEEQEVRELMISVLRVRFDTNTDTSSIWSDQQMENCDAAAHPV